METIGEVCDNEGGAAELGFLPRLNTCIDCGLYRTRRNIVSGVGKATSDIMFVAEAPGPDEDRQGTPLVGRAGELFNSILSRCNLLRSTVVVTNTIRCFPLDPSTGSFRVPSDEEIAACRKHLENEVRLVRPKVIVAMGATAYKALTGKKNQISKARGVPVSCTIAGHRCEVLPTFHPSYVLRNGGLGSAYAGMLQADINYAKAIVNPPKGGTYHVVQTVEEFEAFKKEALSWPRFALDIETRGLDLYSSTILGIGFSGKRGEGWYIPDTHWQGSRLEPFWPDDTQRNFLAELLTGPARKTTHNGKFDILRIRTLWKIEVSHWVFDSMLAAHTADENKKSYRLKELLAQRYSDLVGYDSEIRQLIGGAKEKGTKKEVNDLVAEAFAKLPVSRIGVYAAKDADGTFRLSADLYDELKEQEGLLKYFTEFTMPTAHALMDLEQEGVVLDESYCRDLDNEFGLESDSLLARIRSLTGNPKFNPRSGPQVVYEFFTVRGYKSTKVTKTKKPSTDKFVLASLAKGGDDLAPLILQYKALATARSTYLKPLPLCVGSDNRIHCSFHQHRTVTSRLSCSDPNLQNIPVRTALGRRVRDAIICPPDYSMLCADYSQMELRILAWESQDPTLLDAFERDLDLHTITAQKVFGRDSITPEERSLAKTANFALIYGAEAQKIAETVGISLFEADTFIQKWFATFPRVRTFFDSAHKEARDLGYVTSVFGCRRRFPGLLGVPLGGQFDPRVAESRRQAANFKVQNPASEITCRNMKRACDLFHRGDAAQFGVRTIIQIHDAICFYVPDRNLDIVTPMIEQLLLKPVAPIDVRLKVDTKIVKRFGGADLSSAPTDEEEIDGDDDSDSDQS